MVSFFYSYAVYTLSLGCYIRAYLYSNLISKYARQTFPGKQFARPQNHWVFGSLGFKSKPYKCDSLETSGIQEVTWNFHVAPIIKLGNEYYILDPSVSATPIIKSAWYRSISQRDKAHITGYVTCKENTVRIGDDDCQSSQFDENKNKDHMAFLTDEIDKFLEL